MVSSELIVRRSSRQTGMPVKDPGTFPQRVWYLFNEPQLVFGFRVNSCIKRAAPVSHLTRIHITYALVQTADVWGASSILAV